MNKLDSICVNNYYRYIVGAQRCLRNVAGSCTLTVSGLASRGVWLMTDETAATVTRCTLIRQWSRWQDDLFVRYVRIKASTTWNLQIVSGSRYCTHYIHSVQKNMFCFLEQLIQNLTNQVKISNSTVCISEWMLILHVWYTTACTLSRKRCKTVSLSRCYHRQLIESDVGLSNSSNSDDLEWPSTSFHFHLLQAFPKCDFFVYLCSSWQHFNWHSLVCRAIHLW